MASTGSATLDHHKCYRALRTRDARFDGRFFTGVRTTGIYCRPICPARMPKASNVTFYACAAAAEEAGFRPCKRCRPETAPGTPAWLGTSSTVSRALRLIAQGALDRDGRVEALADRLGVTSRHLRRLFDEHLGASPIAIAQARRVHFAKSLLERTRMPITQVAFASGFSSVRRFNTAFAKTFRQPPREVRSAGRGEAPGSRVAKGGRRSPAGSPEQSLELRLAYREPYDYEALLGFLAARATPGVEAVEQGRYLRTVCFGDDTGTIEVARDPAAAQLMLRIPVTLAQHALTIAERTRRLFDLSADSRVIEDQLAADPLLRAAVRRFSGTRVPGSWDGFETAVRAVVGQQISVKGATTLSGRIAAVYGEGVTPGGAGCERLAASPEALQRLRAERVGLTRARANTLRALARAVERGDLCFDAAAELDETLASLQALPGIGPWTSQYIAMRACGEPDAFPSGDLILRRVAGTLDPRLDRGSALEAHAERWRPWRAYAAMMLWRLYATTNAKTSAKTNNPTPRARSTAKRSRIKSKAEPRARTKRRTRA